jgi:proton-dependent oligopeptide transporter, POT family
VKVRIRNKIKYKFTKNFGFLLMLQFFEKAAYWCVLIQMPVYIAQKDTAGGLHWEQSLKGIIFFWWALFQNLTPVFSGGLSDKYGYRRFLSASFVMIITGYLIMGLEKNFYLFLFGTIILGIGSGIFKPIIQGAISKELDNSDKSLGWGIYFTVINLSVFLASPVSKYLKEISFVYVFFGAMIIFSANFIFLLFIMFNNNDSMRNIAHSAEVESSKQNESDSLKINIISQIFIVWKNTFTDLLSGRIIFFIMIISGFTMIYMQFYETLPNFLLDWSESAQIANYLPSFMLTKTNTGIGLSYEWLYNLNSILTIFFVAWISFLFSKINRLHAILCGILLAVAGIFLTGFFTTAIFTISGFIVYTFGEMIVNPKFTEHFASFSDKKDDARFLSYLNIPVAIGLTLGSLTGGYLYKYFGEKSYLALKYLQSEYKISNISNENAVNYLMKLTGWDAGQLSKFLWNYYHPYLFWSFYLIIGLCSLTGLIIYKRWDVNTNHKKNYISD